MQPCDLLLDSVSIYVHIRFKSLSGIPVRILILHVIDDNLARMHLEFSYLSEAIELGYYKLPICRSLFIFKREQ